MGNLKYKLDKILKCTALFFISAVAVVLLVFSILGIINKVSTGSEIRGTFSTTIYFNPYHQQDKNVSKSSNVFDNTKSRDGTWIPKSKSEMSDELINTAYALSQRLTAYGFQEAEVTTDLNTSIRNRLDDFKTQTELLLKNDASLNRVNETWLKQIDTLPFPDWLKDYELPSVTVKVNKPDQVKKRSVTLLNDQPEEKMDIPTRLISKVISSTQHYSLETTDGIELFSYQDFSKSGFKSESKSNSSGSSNTVFLKVGLSSDPQQIFSAGSKSMFDSVTHKLNSDITFSYTDQNSKSYKLISESSDYAKGGIGTNTSWSKDKDTSSSTHGNRILVFWKNKTAALEYVRNLWTSYKNRNVISEKASRDYFNELEEKLGRFLVTGSQDVETPIGNVDSNFHGFVRAEDIMPRDLYYIFANPKKITEDDKVNNNSSATKHTKESDSSSSSSSFADLTSYAPLLSSFIGTHFLAEELDSSETKSFKLTSDFASMFSNNELASDSKMNFSMSQFNVSLKNNGYDYSKNFSVNDLSYLDAQQEVYELGAGSLGNDVFILGTWTENNGPTLVPTFAFKSESSFNVVVTIGIFLVVFALVLLIGMSIFYKLFGAISAVGILLGTLVTSWLFFQFAGTLTVSSIIGILLISILDVIFWIHIFESAKKNIRLYMSINDSYKKAFQKTFTSIFDSHLIYLSLGIPLLSFGLYNSLNYGVLLIVGSLVSFFITYGLVVLFIAVIINLKIWTSVKIMLLKKYQKYVLTNEQLDSSMMTIFDRIKDTTRFSCVSKNKKIIFWIIFSLIILFGIAGLVLGLLFNKTIVLTEYVALLQTKYIFISWAVSFAFSLIYLGLRYRWPALVNYLISTVLFMFVLLSIPFVINITLDINLLLMLITLHMVFSSMFVLQQNQLYQLFKNQFAYEKDKFKLIFDNVFTNKLAFNIVSIVLTGLVYTVFILFNIGGLNNVYNESLLWICLVIWISLISMSLLFIFVFEQIQYFILFKRNIRIEKIQNSKSENKIRKIPNLEPFDEQLIPGINVHVSADKLSTIEEN